METAICPQCGEIFTKIRPNQKYCRRKCYNEIFRPKTIKTDKTCPECGKTFKGNKKEKYCSTNCRRAKKNRNNKEYRELDGIRMTCRICGRRFQGKKNSPLCSKKCRHLFFTGGTYDK